MQENNFEKQLSSENINAQKLIRYHLQNIDQLNTNINYFSETFLEHKIRNVFILIFSILVFLLEFFYRDILFKYSLNFEENWQKISPEILIAFFRIITKIGGEYLMALPVFIVISFFSIVKTVIYITGFVFCLSFHSTLKMRYGSKRPFWENPNLYKGICDGGFGNPSGHSVNTVYLYLALFIILKDTKYVNDRFHVQSILLIVSLLWTISIILSRLILGVHSVNQVIYGSTFGLVVVLNMFIVFRLHKMPVFFYKRLFKNIKYNIIILSLLFLLTIIAIISKFIFNQDFNYEYYNKILNDTCDNLKEYRKFNYDALFGSLIIVGLIGLYFGQMFFWYLVKYNYKKNDEVKEIKNKDNDNTLCEIQVTKNENWMTQDGDTKEDLIVNELINHWNDNRIFMSNQTNILKIFCVLLICSSPIILFILIGGENMLLIFIFKFGVPFFLVFFLIFGPGFYYVIKFTCGPKKVILKQIFKDSVEEINRGDLEKNSIEENSQD